ncbi:MAG: cysteine desulfurase [Acidimicrobiales bacterium]|nr:cysteine desulfurase [Acidimicrobiales bacterium]
MSLTRFYLDHASTSPVRPEAIDAMVACLRTPTGDPGRLHTEAMHSRAAIEHARDQVAALVGARSREVVFTSGATEAIMTAVQGAVPHGGHVVCSAVEHRAVRDAAERRGEVTVVGVDACGRVDPDELLAAVRSDTALVNVQWANHEVGTTQPIADIASRCREAGVLLHVDAAQAVGHLPVAFDHLGIDLLSFSGHKFGAPPGAGALLVRRGLRIEPLLVGGDQERARRAGLENTPAILGLGAACAALADGGLESEAARAHELTERAAAGLDALPGVARYGHRLLRAPHIVCVGFAEVEPQPVLLGLDRAGVAVHSGSACSSESLEPSPVLSAMGVDAARSLRVSVGWDSTEADVDALLRHLPDVLADLRSLRSDT